CEPEAVAAGTARLVRPVEAFEDVRQVCGGDADARVDHLHPCCPGGLRRHADLDPAPGGGELHGVLHEVGPHLREQAGVRLDAHPGCVELDVHVVGRPHGFEREDCAAHVLVQLEWPALQMCVVQ